MQISAYLCLVFLLVLVSLCQGKDVAPGVSEYLYCEGCIATVKELRKITDVKTTEPKDLVVSEAIEKICKPYNFVTYDYSPPKTVKACNLLIERHDEEIETAFVKRNKDDLEDIVCNKISKACANVDRSKKPKDAADIDLTTNGKEEKVQKVLKMDQRSGQPVAEKDSAKTLSKKDKKSKKKTAKKEKKKTTEQSKKKLEEKKKAAEKAGASVFNVDINDPDSMSKVMEQIKQATDDHKKDFYQKQAEKESKKAKEEL